MTAPPDIVRVAYVDLVVTDLDRSREWWVDLIGFHVEDTEPGIVYLRGYEEFVHHSVVLREGPQPACSRIGFRVRTPECLDRAEKFYRDRGCAVQRVEAGTTLGLGEAVRAVDPLGFTLEFVHHMDRAEPLVQRYDLRRGASINRLDHVNVATPNIAASYELYTELGFGLSETIEDTADGTLYATWMFRKQTVHDMAFTMGSGPMLHHVAFAVPESHNILGLADVLGSKREERWIERGPGRHGVSNAFYLYLRDPDGHRIEIYTTDYFTGDPDHQTIRWDVHDERRRDFWANPIVPTWYHGSVPVLDLDGVPIAIVEEAPRETTAAKKVTVGADGLGTVVD